MTLIIINVNAQKQWIPAAEPQIPAPAEFANVEVTLLVAFLVKLVVLDLASVERRHLVLV